LDAVVEATASDEGERRQLMLGVLREALEQGRAAARNELEAGARGVKTARRLSQAADAVVGALYGFTTAHVFRASNPTEGERLSLVAVGGYGRGVLAPWSDLDLLFLRPWKPTAHVESVIEFMLYALWDLGLKVGHASRTVDESLRVAKGDYTVRTALLEARLVAGDEALFEELRRRYRKEIASGEAAEFIAEKLRERDVRHAKAGGTRYLVEPNVKDGKGGLRDLNTLLWIARYLNPADEPVEVLVTEYFDGREIRALRRAYDFLWAVRSHLHFAAGRAEERLGFDYQPEIARRMGYAEARGGTAAVERFMRRYFLVAREVGVLTRVFVARLEAGRAKRRSMGLSRFLPVALRGRAVGAPGFRNEGGRLNVAGPETFERDPLNLLRLFLMADRRDLDLHPDAFAAASRSLHLITPRLRRDPHGVRAFLDVLAHGQQTYRTLSLMNEAGVLGRFVPEFGRVTARTQFNMYHSYTVDEHTLRAIGVIADVQAGRLAEDHPLATSIIGRIADREALYLAMLLHDTGKGGEGGQEAAGGRAARAACERMGLEPARVELVGWLVEHHLLLSDYAQKRDVSDPGTVAAFAEIVGDLERLRMLLVLTVADVRAVGPGVWNAWKGQLMRDLYAATEAAFRGGRGADAASGFRRRQAEVAEAARARLVERDAAAGDFAAAMEDAYFASFPEAEQLQHAELVRRAANEGGAAASARVRAELNAAEVAVAAQDRPGLFADLAAALAAAGADVLDARIYTSRAGQAFDVFHLQDAAGEPYGAASPKALRDLAEQLAEAARAGAWAPGPRPATGRAAAFVVPPTVVIDEQSSLDAVIVEVSARDRSGLLADVAHVFTDAGLSITSAHVGGYGERVIDAFYLTDSGGAKPASGSLAALREALAEVLGGDVAAPAGGRERARASAAR
jgi:[protein-PII] uridylyltransferase